MVTKKKSLLMMSKLPNKLMKQWTKVFLLGTHRGNRSYDTLIIIIVTLEIQVKRWKHLQIVEGWKLEPIALNNGMTLHIIVRHRDQGIYSTYIDT